MSGYHNVKWALRQRYNCAAKTDRYKSVTRTRAKNVTSETRTQLHDVVLLCLHCEHALVQALGPGRQRRTLLCFLLCTYTDDRATKILPVVARNLVPLAQIHKHCSELLEKSALLWRLAGVGEVWLGDECLHARSKLVVVGVLHVGKDDGTWQPPLVSVGNITCTAGANLVLCVDPPPRSTCCPARHIPVKHAQNLKPLRGSIDLFCQIGLVLLLHHQLGVAGGRVDQVWELAEDSGTVVLVSTQNVKLTQRIRNVSVTFCGLTV